MSDSEATAGGASEVAPEMQKDPHAETPDSSPPPVPDNSTDVAPTRKARRRPDVDPAAEEQEIPKEEEQHAKAPVR